LLRSHKLQKRAARVGFEWPDVTGPIDKLREELDELAQAQTDDEKLMEAGDVLFSVVNIVRRYGVDPEQALRASNAKFERRFRKMEELSQNEGEDFAALDLDGKETYWQRAKRTIG
jgi:ATP diphosphatase